jgi:hypothetical protein
MHIKGKYVYEDGYLKEFPSMARKSVRTENRLHTASLVEGDIQKKEGDIWEVISDRYEYVRIDQGHPNAVRCQFKKGDLIH